MEINYMNNIILKEIQDYINKLEEKNEEIKKLKYEIELLNFEMQDIKDVYEPYFIMDKIKRKKQKQKKIILKNTNKPFIPT